MGEAAGWGTRRDGARRRGRRRRDTDDRRMSGATIGGGTSTEDWGAPAGRAAGGQNQRAMRVAAIEGDS